MTTIHKYDYAASPNRLKWPWSEFDLDESGLAMCGSEVRMRFMTQAKDAVSCVGCLNVMVVDGVMGT